MRPVGAVGEVVGALGVVQLRHCPPAGSVCTDANALRRRPCEASSPDAAEGADTMCRRLHVCAGHAEGDERWRVAQLMTVDPDTVV